MSLQSASAAGAHRLTDAVGNHVTKSIDVNFMYPGAELPGHKHECIYSYMMTLMMPFELSLPP